MADTREMLAEICYRPEGSTSYQLNSLSKHLCLMLLFKMTEKYFLFILAWCNSSNKL